MTGSGYPVSQFASNLQYSAWGTLKSETYGNGFTESAGYNARLQLTSFEVRKSNNDLAMSSSHQYYADGSLKFSNNALDERFDRAYSYDHTGRAVEAYSGSEARDFVNGTNSGTQTGPYRQSYQYNPFSEITQQTNRFWSETETVTSTFSNNRQADWAYDAAGFVSGADGTSYTRDAAGRNVQADSETSHGTYTFDGDGQALKTVLNTPGFHGGTRTTTVYYLSSSILGLAVAELNGTGQKTKRYVYAGTRKLAEESGGNLSWSHQEPVTGGRGESGTSVYYTPKAEFNADGINVGLYPPESGGFDIPEAIVHWFNVGLGASCSVGNPNCITCFLDGFEHDCGHVTQLAEAGALQIQVQNRRGETRYVDVDVMFGQLYVPGGHFHTDSEHTGGWTSDFEGQPLYWNSGLTVLVQDIYIVQAAFLPSVEQHFFGEQHFAHGNPDSLWGRRRHPHSPGWRQKPVKWGSACGKFARSLANRLYNTVVRDHPYGDDNSGNLAAVGVPMRAEAIDNVDQNGDPYRKGKTPIDGFKEYLTAHGQDADVYHHILFVAGNVLDGNYGFGLNQAFIAYDRAQAAMGRKESEAEVADDEAGEKVGNAMLKTGKAGASGDYESLALTIARILCK